MNLVKRECPIQMEFYPLGNELLEMQLILDGEEYIFHSSSVMCGQINQFISNVYSLYSEEWDGHRTLYWIDRTNECTWLTDSDHVSFKFERLKYDYKSETHTDDPNIISITIRTENKTKKHLVNDKDLAYAIGKAGTKTLKEFGFYGYYISTGSKVCNGDAIDINQLLFLKAYALDAMNVRKLKTFQKSRKSWQSFDVSSFGKELELLLFDM